MKEDESPWSIRNPNPKYENGFEILWHLALGTFEKLMMKIYDFFLFG